MTFLEEELTLPKIPRDFLILLQKQPVLWIRLAYLPLSSTCIFLSLFKLAFLPPTSTTTTSPPTPTWQNWMRRLFGMHFVRYSDWYWMLCNANSFLLGVTMSTKQDSIVERRRDEELVILISETQLWLIKRCHPWPQPLDEIHHYTHEREQLLLPSNDCYWTTVVDGQEDVEEDVEEVHGSYSVFI